MDFHTLSRKQLQILCKKNKIPANITNVAMADALAALNQVEGLDEFLNPREVEAGTPDVRRVTSERKSVREEAEESKVKVSTSTRRAKAEGGVVEEENKDANVTVTPAVSRRRATAVSTRRKKKSSEDDDKNVILGKPADVPKTPAAPPSSRTRAYNTRRSVRLLEKNLSKINLMDAEDTGLPEIDDVSQELSDGSQQIEDSSATEKGASLQTVSTVVSEELEVSSLERTTEDECQSIGSGSEVKLVSVTENVMEAGLNDDEPKEDAVNDFEAESHDSNLKLEGNCDSNETGSGVLLVLEESFDTYKECVVASQESLPVEASKDAMHEVSDQEIAAVLPSDDVSVDVTEEDVAASVSLKELVECNIDDQGQGCKDQDDKQDENNEPQEEGEPHDSNLKLEGGSVVSSDDSDIAGSVVVPLLEETCDSSELEIESKECLGAKQDALLVQAPEDAFMEKVTNQDIAALIVVIPDDVSMDVTDEDAAGLLPMSSVKDDSVSLKEFAGCSLLDDQGSKEGDDKQDKNNETENLLPMLNDEKATEEKNLTSSEIVLELGLSIFCSSGEHHEEPEEAEESRTETEKIDNASDIICEHSAAVVEVSPESSAEGNESMEVQNVTLESSLLDVEAEHYYNNFENMEAEAEAEENVTLESSLLDVEAEDHNNNSENMEAEGQAEENVTLESSLVNVEAEDHMNNSENLEAEESKERAAGEDADNAVSSVLDGFPLDHEQVAVESSGIHVGSCSSDGVLSCNSNKLVDGDVVSEDIVITNQEPHVSLEAMTVASIHEQKTIDVPIQSVVSDQLKGDMHNAGTMKENLTADELHKKSMGELKRMLKKLALDDKSNCKTDVVVKEVKKRTALQALPQNQMTKGEAQNE